MKHSQITSIKIILLTSICFSCSMNTIFKLEKNPNPTLNNTCTISGFVLDRKTKNRLLERYKPYSKSNIVFEANFRYSINVELVFDLWVNDYLFSKRKSAE